MSRRRRSWHFLISRLLYDVVILARLALTPRAQLAAENLFLRKQLALYQERKVKPRRADDATRFILASLSRVLAWRQLLVIVKAGDTDPLASEGIPTVLALDITGARP